MILCIETSSHFCSVALANVNGEVVASMEVKESLAHGRVLVPLIQKLVNQTGISQEQWNAVALSAGPGSYTGLRMGSAVAKSIAMAHNIPIIPVCTLKLLYIDMLNMAQNTPLQIPNECLWAPMMDARRMEVYTAVYNTKSETRIEPQAHIASANTAQMLWNSNPVILGGNGAQKIAAFLEPYLPNPRSILAVFPQALPKAQNMASLAATYYSKKQWVNCIQFEPQYLKPYYTQAQPTHYATPQP